MRGTTEHCLDGVNQFCVRERLGDTSKLFRLRIKSVAESGHKENGDARLHFSDVFYQLSTRHAWHEDVGEKKVDTAPMLLEHVQGLRSTAGLQNGKPRSLQERADKSANHCLVIDNEYALRGGLHSDFLWQYM